MAKGIVFDIQKFSLYDGPGIRTTVFLKGCPLRCMWCHNPESHSFEIETACDSKKIYGREMESQEVIAEVVKDIKYYEKSKGGLTISGGEPLAQPLFTLEILMLAKEKGIHTCIETSGFAQRAIIEKMLPFTDLFLYDYKIDDPGEHSSLTGVSNEIILENLEFIFNEGKDIILRCPIIPGINDTEEHFKCIAELSSRFTGLLGIEMMPYHDMGKGKYKELGREYKLPELKNASREQSGRWLEYLNSLGCHKAKIG